MGKRLVGVIKFHFQFLCFSYAELLYSCACVFEMFECRLYRASMSNDDRQGYCSNARQSPMGGYGEGGHTYDAQQLCNEEEVGKMYICKSWEDILREHCQNWLNQVFNRAVRMNLFMLIQDFASIWRRLYKIFFQLGLFPFFLVWRRLRCRWVACKEINPIDPTRGWIIHE